MQARRSLLVWKVYGKRLDGFSNDDHPSETEPGSTTLSWKGKPVDLQKHRHRVDVDFTGDPMPPAKAVAEGKVKPLSDDGGPAGGSTDGGAGRVPAGQGATP
jgi:hypothetical protein